MKKYLEREPEERRKTFNMKLKGNQSKWEKKSGEE